MAASERLRARSRSPASYHMRIGLKLPQLGPRTDRAAVHDFCVAAESLGYDSLWGQEHLFYPLEPESGYSGVPDLPVPDPYRRTLDGLTLLTAAAAWTTRVRLGTHLVVVGNHHPLQLAQRVATIDVLCEGRLDLGLGVGWSVDEHQLLGVDPTTRGRRFDDFITALLACWGDDPVEHRGPFFTIPPSYVGPKPVQRPHPPLLVGFFSDRGIDRAVRSFDGWLTGVSLEEGAVRLKAMNALRSPRRAPMTIFGCAFPRSPLAGESDPDGGIDTVVETVEQARRLDYDEVIIDCNFWGAVDSDRSWAAIPEQMAPALDAAHAPHEPHQPGVRSTP